MTTFLLGVDSDVVNKPGGLVDDLRDAGGDFGFVKLTQGTYFDYTQANYTPPATARIQQIIDKGMVAGAYHFLTRVENDNGDAFAFNSGTLQCDYFAARLPGGSPEGLLIALDVESNPSADAFTGPDGSIHDPHPGGPKRAEIHDWLNRWFELFPNHPVFLYSNVGEWRSNIDLGGISPLIFKWNASRQDKATHWDGNFDATEIDLTSTVWGGLPSRSIIEQYGYVKFPGYGHVLDADVFVGTRDDLLKYSVSNGAIDPPDDDHPKTIRGFNDMLDAAIAAIPSINPDTGVGGANYRVGIQRAKDSLLTFAAAQKVDGGNG